DRNLVGGAENYPGRSDLEQRPDGDVDGQHQRGRTVGEAGREPGAYLDVPLGHERDRISRSVSAVDRAAAAACPPLSSADPGSPARSIACSSLLVVSTPLATGVPASS